MIRILSMASLALFSSAAVVGSVQAAPAARACFYANELSSWKEVGDQTVNLRVNVSDIYQVQLLASCPDLRFAETIGVETRGGDQHICSGLDLSIIVPSSVTHTVPQRCMATGLRKLSSTEAKSLPRGEKP